MMDDNRNEFETEAPPSTGNTRRVEASSVFVLGVVNEIGADHPYYFVKNNVLRLKGYKFPYTESEISRDLDTGNGHSNVNVPLEELSPRVYAAILFYDYKDFDRRLSVQYRSSYLGNVNGSSNNLAFITEETIFDYQASFDITENFDALVSVNNLTDEANRSYYGDRSKTGNIQYFGRNYFVGIDYSF